jgi:hypothetical protein
LTYIHPVFSLKHDHPKYGMLPTAQTAKGPWPNFQSAVLRTVIGWRDSGFYFASRTQRTLTRKQTT